jgi:CRP-like cAMP-binding protein
MSGPVQLKKGDILFREGDPSEAMYVIKSGQIAITKAKGSSEIILAELGPGDMLGEMAFFDNKPRSAGARALQETIVIELPFKALSAQFKTFPEWLKAIVRTVNTHLRNANQKIKNLERATTEDDLVLPPHMANRLMAILGLIGSRYGEKYEGDLVSVPPNRLRNYTIQVFQAPTNKMEILLMLLQGLGYLKVEDLGEGKQRITTNKLDFIMAFVDFYTGFLFAPDDKRTAIDEKELRPLKTLLHYARTLAPDAKGLIKLDLTSIQNDSMKDLGYLFTVDDVNSLISKGLFPEKMTGEAGHIMLSMNRNDIQTIYPFWELIHAFNKVQRS